MIPFGGSVGSLKSLHALCDKYLDHMLVKFEQNHMVRTIYTQYTIQLTFLT